MDTSKNLKKVLYNISEKTGKGSIYVYYSNKGSIKRFPTGVKIAADKWNSKECKPNHKALTYDDSIIVDNTYNKILQLINDFQYQYKELPPISYIEQNLNKPKTETDIHQLFSEYVDRIAVTNDLKPNSITYYKMCGKRVKEVADYYNYNLTVDTLNYSFIQLFIKYCKEVKVLKNNTIKQRLDVLKSFVRDLGKHEIEHSIKIDTWNKINTTKVDFYCLEKNEIEAIKEYTPKSNREDKIKDIILFLSHTGMRISDMSLITKANVENDMLVFKPIKTLKHNIVCKVPISKPVREILEKYNYKLPSYTGKYLNPYISDFCGQIKVIKKTGKQEFLTSHSVGRKTFLNLCIQANIPISTVMRMTGHSTIDTVVQHYLDKYQNVLPQLNDVFEFDSLPIKKKRTSKATK